MKQSEVTMVRVYCSEKGHQHREIVDLLHREHRVAGVTAFRGIAGFGRSGHIHEAGLLDVSLDLPVIVEFFDRPEVVAGVLPEISEMVGAGHIVSWPAHANLD
jgi:PII-like signaling protein